MCSGITDLSVLLASMSPEIDTTEYVFCSLDISFQECSKYQPIATFKESEGMTLVLIRSVADTYNLPYQCVMQKITLTVHSSLEAVGLTAAFANALKEANISANVIAGFYHDHIFVPAEQSDKAMHALRTLSKKYR
ncbi:ACT domain-containing protein [Pseudoalteromonas sp. T1lg65]|uniref:ACT domain-containing protein n=1 Tax=Pseudoalteromonas sp. T1lg65 TaxID=2077101 RepID=UPI003F7AB61D